MDQKNSLVKAISTFCLVGPNSMVLLDNKTTGPEGGAELCVPGPSFTVWIQELDSSEA